MRGFAFLVVPLLLTIGCDHTAPTAPDEASVTSAVFEGDGPQLASAKGLDKAGFVPFVSLNHGCGFELLASEVVDGTLIMHWSNHNIEVSREAMFAGPATSTARGVIDLATGKWLEFEISFVHEPTAVDGTWEVVQYDILLIDDQKPIKAYLAGIGTGDLEGLGIEYMVVINAKAAAAPPHIVCEGGMAGLSKGKIFQLD